MKTNNQCFSFFAFYSPNHLGNNYVSFLQKNKKCKFAAYSMGSEKAFPFLNEFCWYVPQGITKDLEQQERV